MSDFFNEAYRRARARYTADQWLALPPQQVTQAIYQAMRDMDAATIRQANRPRNKVARPTQDDQPHQGDPPRKL